MGIKKLARSSQYYFKDAMEKELECFHCGLCCIVWEIPITNEDMVREPKITEHVHIHKTKNINVIGNPDKITPCPFLDSNTNLCTIYETRPQRCREFKASPKMCMSAYIETTGIGVQASVEDWLAKGIQEHEVLAHIYGKYLQIKQLEVLEDFLIKTVNDEIKIKCPSKKSKVILDPMSG